MLLVEPPVVEEESVPLPGCEPGTKTQVVRSQPETQAFGSFLRQKVVKLNKQHGEYFLFFFILTEESVMEITEPCCGC